MRALIVSLFALAACSSSTTGTSTPDHECAQVFSGTWTLTDTRKDLSGDCAGKVFAEASATVSVDSKLSTWTETSDKGERYTFTIGGSNSSCSTLVATTTSATSTDGLSADISRVVKPESDGSLSGTKTIVFYTSSAAKPTCEAHFSTTITK